MTQKKKKRYRLSRIFNNIPHMAVNFVLARPPNQNWIIDKYAEDKKIDLNTEEIRQKIAQEMERDVEYAYIPIPGLKELATNPAIFKPTRFVASSIASFAPAIRIASFSFPLGLGAVALLSATPIVAVPLLAFGLINGGHFVKQVSNHYKGRGKYIALIEKRREEIKKKELAATKKMLTLPNGM